MRNRNEETICAVSTPPGKGGIAVIRVSGSKALQHFQKLSPHFSKTTPQSHQAKLCAVFDLQENKVDEVLATYFANGKSFTGEEVVEVSCHGSEYITAKILDLLIQAGCRLADRGEFTYRAFMNNRMDLVQAESVLSLIESQSELAAKIAIRQLDGHTSKNYLKIESDLTWCLAHIEASIDFSTEGIDVVDQKVLLNKIQEIKKSLESLINSYHSGRIIKDGVKVVLVGEPNAGKSSLLNSIVQDDKAIVTAIAGTTRDVIEGATVFKGVKYSISDTAGLRTTHDIVEKIGVEKSLKEASGADILCFILDLEKEDWTEASDKLNQLQNTRVLVIANKLDLAPETTIELVRKKLQGLSNLQKHFPVVLASALASDTRSRVLEAIETELGGFGYVEEATISSTRQFENASYAFEMIATTIAELEKNAGAEFVAMYLKEALLALQKILGHTYDDQIMDRVFKEFCLGK